MSRSEDWDGRKPAGQMQPGDRFIFSDSMGGEGEVLTVVSIDEFAGIVDIATEELDFSIQAMAHQRLDIPEEDDEEEV